MADHVDQFAKIFGIQDVTWYVGKAEREMARYSDSKSDQDRTDALLNFSATILGFEDWTSNLQKKSPSEWKSELRDASNAHTLFALIALVAKHRVLSDGRFRDLTIRGDGQIGFYVENSSPEEIIEWVRKEWPQAKIVSVRTHVDDDCITAFSVLVDAVGIGLDHRVEPIDELMAAALKFWKEKLQAIR